jgi:hypothetical protein
MGQVAQVKIPLRLVRDGFKVSIADINAVGEHAKVLVRAVSVRVHADGKLDPRVYRADIRGKGGGDAYLTTKDYGALRCCDVWECDESLCTCVHPVLYAC